MPKEFNLMWHGKLTAENMPNVATLLQDLLGGKRHCVVEASSEGGLVPLVKTGCLFNSAIDHNDGFIYIHEDHTCYQVLPGAFFRFEYNKVIIRHKAPSGNELAWVFAV